MHKQGSSSRFVFIDALRGVAASAVTLHHAVMSAPIMYRPDVDLIGRALRVVVDSGERGVQIFFVISGFVIGHSLRNTPLTAPEIGRFILRRQARLDPPYWVMLLVAMGLWQLRARMPGVQAFPMTFADLGLNMVYLQRVLDAKDVIGVGWTLCTEIQFYLFFVLLLRLGTRRGETNGGGPSALLVGLVTVTALAALPLGPNHTHDARWAGSAWPFFAAGALCYWAARRQAPAWPLFAVCAGLVVAGGLTPTGQLSPSPALVGVVTAVAIYLVSRASRLGTLWANAPVQYLGRISYSLYLVHMPVVSLLGRGAYRYAGDGIPAFVGVLLASLAVSVALAHIFHRLVEAPSMRLSGWLKAEPRPEPATTEVSEPVAAGAAA